MDVRLTAVYFKEGDWWIGTVPEIGGAHTQGATLDEARQNLAEALSLILDANRELAERDFVGRDVIREDLTALPAAR